MAKIIGNTVGIPNPQPDCNQTDPTKADYIKNKPDYIGDKNKLKYYGRVDIEITPAYKLGEIIPEDVEMCLIYEIDEETQTASITGYHAPYWIYDEDNPNYDECIDYIVVIPYEVDGYPVTKIGDYAFSDWRYDGYAPIEEYALNRSELIDVIFPTTVTHLGEGALFCCGLRSIKILATIKTFGSYVLSDCYYLKEVEFEDGVTTISDHMFFYNSNLQTVKLPKTLLNIGSYAFYDCPLKTVEIPDSVTSIGEYAFSCEWDDEYDSPFNIFSAISGIIFLNKSNADSFENYHPTAFLHCERIYVCQNSAIEQWCVDNSYSIIYTDIDLDGLNVDYADYAHCAHCDADGNDIVETYARKEELSALKFIKVVNELPEIGEKHYIYLIPNNSDESSNIYDEYIWVNNKWEHLGAKQIEIDLSNYVEKEDGKGLSEENFTSVLKKQIEDTDKDRHTHENKEILDNITQEKIEEWDSNTGGSALSASITDDVLILEQTSDIPNNEKANYLKKDYTKITELEITEEDIANAGEDGITVIFVGNEDENVFLPYKDFIIHVFIPETKTSGLNSANKPIYVGTSNILGKRENPFIRTTSSGCAWRCDIPGDYIVELEQIGDDIGHATFTADGNSASCWAVNTWSAVSIFKNQTVKSYNANKYMCLCAYSADFKFPTGTKVTVYGK